MGREFVRHAALKTNPLILVDTSVWIDYFRGKETPHTRYLTEAIGRGDDLCISGIILTEILQGISSDKEYRSVKSLLHTLIFLPMFKKSYELAADIYRRAKAKGQTIRNTIDCLIAACAIAHETPLLQNDKDYLVVSQFSNLRLVLQ